MTLIDQSSSHAMPAVGASGHASNWSNDIWASRASGHAGRNNSDSNRAQPRPAPLSRPSTQNSEVLDDDDNATDNPDRITGSGSLLSSSESEPPSRNRWMSTGTISAPQTGARAMETSVSPALQRSAQMPQNGSAYFQSQRSAVGQVPAPKSTGGLNPNSQSFDFDSSLALHGPYGSSGSQGPIRSHDGLRPSASQVNFGSFGAQDGQPYSGPSSRAASRNGSLPPSQHGSDFPLGFDGLQARPLPNQAPDVFGHRPNQPSRNSTFSSNSSHRTSENPWQSTVTDLPSALRQMNLSRASEEQSEPSFYDESSDHLHHPVGLDALNGRLQGIASAQRTSPALLNANGAFGSSPHSSQNLRLPLDLHSAPSSGRSGFTSPSNFNADNIALARHGYGHSISNNLQPGLPNGVSDRTFIDRRGAQRLPSQQMNSLLQAQALQQLQSPFNGSFGFDAGAQRLQTPMDFFNGLPTNGLPAGYASQTPLPLMSQQFFPRMPPRGPARDASQEKLRSPLLDEFKDKNKSNDRKWELKDLYGHIVEFIGDQSGSRFIQGKLESANSDEKAQVFAEMLPNALQLMSDVFGNYVIQRFFEHGTQTQKKQLADKMTGHIFALSIQPYGCRVVQKAFEHILTEQQATLVRELENHVQVLVEDQHGNHVIQKAIQRIPPEHITFMVNSFTHQIDFLAKHAYGCRVVQRLLEHGTPPVRANVLAELHACYLALIVDPYGNYVVQHVLQNGGEQDKARVHELLCRNFLAYARHKYASNVLEKAVEMGTEPQRQQMLRLVWPDGGADELMQKLLQDQFANYVIQKFLSIITGPQRDDFADLVRRNLQIVRPLTKMKQYDDISALVNLGPRATLTAPRPPRGPSVSTAGPPSGRPSLPGRPSQRVASYHNGPPPYAHPPFQPSRHDPNFPQQHQSHLSPPHSQQSTFRGVPPPLDLEIAPTPGLLSEDSQSPQSSSQPSTTDSNEDGPVASTNSSGTVVANVSKTNHMVQINVVEDESMIPTAKTPKAA